MIKLEDLTGVYDGNPIGIIYVYFGCIPCIQKKGGRGPQGAGDTNAASEIYGCNFSIFCTRNALIQRYVNI
jgi:hypothetical protein